MLAAEGIALEPAQVELLDRYRRLLWEWNEKMNLTRHTTMEKFVTRDVVDSLQLAQLLEQGERVLDVGTGGGVPGVILAIVRPDLKVSLCESTQKKARAVEEMVAELGLPVARLRLPRRGRARNHHVRHAGGPGAGVAGQSAHLAQAALGRVRPAAA